jgi:hypothetical protein
MSLNKTKLNEHEVSFRRNSEKMGNLRSIQIYKELNQMEHFKDDLFIPFDY